MQKKDIRKRYKYYWKSLKWCSFVLVVLFLPYLFSIYVTQIISFGGIEPECSVAELFIEMITNDMIQGKFLFIPISLASASYIDYFYTDGLSWKESIITLGLALLTLLVVGLFTCVFIVNSANENNIDLRLNINVIESVTRIYFIFSVIYAIGVKATIFDFREK